MRDLPYYTKGKISLLLTQTTEKYLISVLFVEADYHHTRVSIYLSQKYEKIFQGGKMIAVVGEPHITLKRLMLGEGFPHLSAYTGPMTTELNGVFNCSYTPTLMSNYVYSRWNYVNSGLPIINKNLVTNKLEAQRRMEAEGVGEHILVWRRQEPSFADHDREPDRWVIKPYASQGGAGIMLLKVEQEYAPTKGAD
jgi:hypothetical protein